MCFSSGKSVAGAFTPAMTENNAGVQDSLNHAATFIPEQITTQTSDLLNDSTKYSELVARANRALQEKLSPGTLAMDQAVQGQVQGNLTRDWAGELGNQIQNAAIKSGLANNFATGASSRSPYGQA